MRVRQRDARSHGCHDNSGSVWIFLCASWFKESRGLTFTFARVLVRAHVDGPGSQPTNTKEPHVVQPVLSCPLLALFQPHVCHRHETGLSPQAHAAGHDEEKLKERQFAR